MQNRVSTLTAMAARIATGLPRENGHKPDVPALLAFWKNNKYPLVVLNDGNAWKELLDSDEFKAAREREAGAFSELRAEYLLVRDRWLKAGIPCLLVKSGGTVPSFPYLSDNLDILVKLEHGEAAKAILRELDYVELRNVEEPRKFLFRKFTGGECVSAIHLHTQVGWEVGFMNEDAIWRRCRVAPDDKFITVPSPEDTILITVAHSFYENKRFKLADVLKVRQCWLDNRIDWSYLESVASERGWLDGLYFCLLTYTFLEESLWGATAVPAGIREGWLASLHHSALNQRYYQRIIRRQPVSLPFKLSFVFSKFLYYKKILNDRHHGLGRKLSDVIQTLLIGVKLKSGIRPQPSLLVSFSGADGSGKTQHARALLKTMTTSGIKTHYYWSRTATSRLTRLCSACARPFLRKRGAKDAPPGLLGRRQRLQNPIIRCLWSYTVAADLTVTYWFRVGLPLLWGRAIVCDRYVFDAAAEMECSLPPQARLSRLAIRLMLALTPKPNAAYLLDIPEKVCAQRKDENSDTGYLRRQRRAYAELASRYHLRIKKTDAEFRDIADKIVLETLVPYFSHIETLLNGLFLSNSRQLNRPTRERR